MNATRGKKSQTNAARNNDVYDVHEMNDAQDEDNEEDSMLMRWTNRTNRTTQKTEQNYFLPPSSSPQQILLQMVRKETHPYQKIIK